MTRKNSKARIKVEYEVDVNGATKLVELPFVMGVMSDLAGESKTEYATRPVAQRDFKVTDAEELPKLMQAIEPRAKGDVKNVLPLDEGEEDSEDRTLSFDLKFKSMSDFTPDEMAKQIPELKSLLKMRQDLEDLLGLMDGKADAEKEIASLLKNKPMLSKIMETVPAAGGDDAPKGDN
ncbi:MAG: type VI secretion system contractile sheath small subunit [Paracoccaceae bacterium]|nr:type VI secretion system contractile sheath small subunit [Paracoccaceae bacterium]